MRICLLVFQFDRRKSGDASSSDSFRNELELRFGNIYGSMRAMMEDSIKRFQFYTSTMGKSIKDHKTYYSNDDLMNLHQELKSDISTEIQMQTDAGNFRKIVRQFARSLISNMINKNALL